ncbi:MAG: hypothetical protein JW861_09620 [Bacteroidales bacterium]|nr:hypothetical protein [Bacteroidales bacterium]
MESKFYQINLMNVLLRWRIHLGIITVGAALLAAVFSSPVFITPKYKSFGILYPSNIAPYSEESESEQMLQIMHSRDIKDSIIKRFDLAKHYGIDSSYRYFYSTISYEYSQNVKISKTPYDGVVIEVMDKDPEKACEMVNEIINRYNNKVRSLHKKKFHEVVLLYDRAMKHKKEYLDSLVGRLYDLSTQYGLIDYEIQAEEITRGFLKTIDGMGATQVNNREVMKLKENIEKYGGELILLLRLIENESLKYTDLKYEYERAYMDYDRKFTYTNILTEPYPADRKSHPIRWLIVLVSALAAFFLSVIVILIIENYRNMSHTKTV